jgi:hypothetical protein
MFREQALNTVKAVKSFARVFPIGRPRAALYQGCAENLDGKHDKALRRWKEALPIARKLGMPYDEALIYLEIGRHLPTQNPEKRNALTQALELFRTLQAEYDIDRTQSELDKIS